MKLSVINFNFGIPLKVIYQTKAGNQLESSVRLFFVDQMDVDKVLQTVRVEIIYAKLECILINTIQNMYTIASRFFTQMLTSVWKGILVNEVDIEDDTAIEIMEQHFRRGKDKHVNISACVLASKKKLLAYKCTSRLILKAMETNSSIISIKFIKMLYLYCRIEFYFVSKVCHNYGVFYLKHP